MTTTDSPSGTHVGAEDTVLVDRAVLVPECGSPNDEKSGPTPRKTKRTKTTHEEEWFPDAVAPLLDIPSKDDEDKMISQEDDGQSMEVGARSSGRGIAMVLHALIHYKLRQTAFAFFVVIPLLLLQRWFLDENPPDHGWDNGWMFTSPLFNWYVYANFQVLVLWAAIAKLPAYGYRGLDLLDCAFVLCVLVLGTILTYIELETIILGHDRREDGYLDLEDSVVAATYWHLLVFGVSLTATIQLVPQTDTHTKTWQVASFFLLISCVLLHVTTFWWSEEDFAMGDPVFFVGACNAFVTIAVLFKLAREPALIASIFFLLLVCNTLYGLWFWCDHH